MLLHFHNPNCAYNHHSNLHYKLRSSTIVNFHLPILPLLVHRIIFTIPTNSLFLYASTILHLRNFAYTHPNNLHEKYFSYLSHLANSGCANGPGGLGVYHCLRTNTVLISAFFLKVWTVITGLTITDSLSLRLRKFEVVVSDEVACNQNHKLSNPPSLSPSTYCHYFHTLLIPSQELTFPWEPAAYLIFILRLAFSYIIHARFHPYV